MMVEELLGPLMWVNDIRRNKSPIEGGWRDRWPSSTTQFVVGAGEETDYELLRMSDYLYSNLKLSRIYYSGFKPIEGTPLENRPAENPLRRYRLYQASFLLRSYSYTLADIPLDQGNNLSLDIDPKMAWARSHLADSPIEVNHAGYNELIRVPGIGPRGAIKIMAIRKEGTIKEIGQLKATGIHLSRVMPFILLAGKQPLFQEMLL